MKSETYKDKYENALKQVDFYKAKLFDAWQTMAGQTRGLQRQARLIKRLRETKPSEHWETEITEYWYDNFATDHCTLCGNTGVIDTRGLRTLGGVEVGRLNWCICPNGQIRNKVHAGQGPSSKNLATGR